MRTSYSFPAIRRTFTLLLTAMLLILGTGVSRAGDLLKIDMSVDLEEASIRDYQVMKFRIRYNCSSTTTDAKLATIVDVMDSNLEVVGLTGSSHTTNATYVAALNTVTFTFKNPLPAGSSGEVFIQARFKSTTANNTVANNKALFASLNPAAATSNTVTVKGINPITSGGGGGLTFTKGMYLSKSNDNGDWVSAMAGWIEWKIYHGNTGNVGENLTNYAIEDTFPAGHMLEWMRPDQFPGTNNAVAVKYKTNKSAAWRVWGNPLFRSGDSPSYFYASSLALPSGEYVTGLRWEYGNLPGGGAFHPDSRWSSLHFMTRLVDPVTAPAGSKVKNCVTQTAAANASKTACDEVTVSTPGPDFGNWHWVNSGGSPFDWNETVTLGSQIGVNPGSNTPLKNPAFGILLPKEIDYVGPWKVEGWGWEQAGSIKPYFEQLPNYKGTGRTMLRWIWSATRGNPMTLPASRDWRYFYVYFDVKVKNYTPNGGYQSDMFSSWEPAGQGYGWFETDTNDWDGDGDVAELAARSYTTIYVETLGGSASFDSVMWVKGELDSAWTKFPSKGETTPGGKADYEIRLLNPSGVVMRNLTVIDILPVVGDTGVIDTTARGSQWSPYLAAPVSAVGATVSYSTSKNPCRDELTPGLPVGCDPPNWTVSPPSDLTTVRSLKIDFGGTPIFPGDEKIISWPMRAPVNAPTKGEVAWNSFGYIATRTDDNTQLLASEPVKTGIAIRPPLPPFYGDCVWNDLNKNGIQDGGEPGMNGVRVELYQDNGDGMNDPMTDPMVQFTVTSNDGSSDGRYLFGNLKPGNFYAVVIPPPDFGITLPNQGTDDTTDSDSEPVLLRGQRAGLMSMTTLDPPEDDRTWDCGLIDRSGLPAVWAVATQADGSSYLGGRFKTSHGLPRRNIVKVAADGSVDPTFNPGGGFDDVVRSLALLPDTRVLVGGNFTTYNGKAVFGAALLNPNGTPALVLPSPDVNNVRWVGVSTQGLYIAGGFAKIAGVDRRGIARYTAKGQLDTSFDSSNGTDGIVNAALIQSDGKIIIGGNFTKYGGLSRSRVARLNLDGTLDKSFDCTAGANGEVFALKAIDDGRVVVTGSFTNFAGVKCNGTMRLLTDGKPDPSISPSTLTVDTIQTTN